MSAPTLDPLAAPSRMDELDEEFNLAEYWKIVKRRWPLLVACALLGGIGGLVQSFLATPLYRASATINIEPEKITPAALMGGGSGGLAYDFSTREYLPTQLELLRSGVVAERAVQKLGLAESEVTGAGKRTSGKKESGVDEAVTPERVSRIARGIQGGIEVSVLPGTTLVTVAYISPSPKLAADVVNAIADSYIEWSSESKARTAGQATQFLSTQVEQLKSEIEQKEKEITAYGMSKDIYTLDPQSNTTLLKLESLNKEYADVAAERVEKEAKYQELMAARPETIVDANQGPVAQLRAEQARLERDYEQKLNIYKPDFPAMQQLKAQIQKGKDHLATVVAEGANRVREAAKNDYLAVQRREENLKDLLRQQKGEAAKLSTNSVEFTNLRVELSTKRSLLDSLLKRQTETDMASRLSTVRQENLRIVDRAALPEYRWRPSYRRNVSRALLFGIFAGIGLVALLEYSDRSLKTSQQVENVLKLPSLGVIVALGERGRRGYGYGYGGYGYGYGYGLRRKKKAAEGKPEAPKAPDIELLPHHHPKSVVSEAYRAFRTSLLLSRAGGVKSIVVTSCFPGEGKTATASNLAVVLAQLNKKVLLVDGDLHKPRVHEVFKISNKVGLVSILTEGLALQKAIVMSPVPDLWVLPAGPIPPNPSGLLQSKAMEEFLAYVATAYDYVVIDSPPVQAVADALILGNQTDGVVITVHGGKTPREHVARVRDKLRRANVRILGILINLLREPMGTGYGAPYRYKGKKGAYGSYGAYGAYGEGYGYGYLDDADATGSSEAPPAPTGTSGSSGAAAKVATRTPMRVTKS
ncbi:MAG: polysaccharide biosynthesis tyrosine autokinase [Acidobacteria bacterium]|nr:MAG: polysaccharide biosynthesis tyrosine autokinase [Acidobacteriota bacterium]MCE7956741.1 polysaccharide biosynthesis tyrosine autokinase [Acidobacteria bacterium ACB2]